MVGFFIALGFLALVAVVEAPRFFGAGSNSAPAVNDDASR